MIAMMIDGPMRENHVRPFGIQLPPELLVMGVVQHGAAIVLPGKSGTGLENSTRFLRFGGTDPSALVQLRCAAEAFTPIQIEQCDLVPQFHIAGDGAAASAFRISRMPASDNHFQTPRGRVRMSQLRCRAKQRSSGGGGKKRAAGDRHGGRSYHRPPYHCTIVPLKNTPATLSSQETPKLSQS